MLFIPSNAVVALRLRQLVQFVPRRKWNESRMDLVPEIGVLRVTAAAIPRHVESCIVPSGAATS
jgi:hypothetical protein